eukprot:1009465-Pyramimonas_sp.AAC.1
MEPGPHVISQLVGEARGARGPRLSPPPRCWTAWTAALTGREGQNLRPPPPGRAYCADWPRRRGKSLRWSSEP